MPMIVLALLLLPGTAAAHGLLDGHLHLNERVPLLLSALLLGAAWLLYILGCRKVRPHGREALWMHLAMVLTVLAVFGPIDDWAETSTSLHMVQHMLFMIVIAPLWALARPLPQWRAVLGGWMAPVSNAILRSGRYPVALAMLHGAMIWVWHTPACTCWRWTTPGGTPSNMPASCSAPGCSGGPACAPIHGRCHTH